MLFRSVSVGDDFGMRIWLNPEKLASLGITAGDVNAALAEMKLNYLLQKSIHARLIKQDTHF